MSIPIYYRPKSLSAVYKALITTTVILLSTIPRDASAWWGTNTLSDTAHFNLTTKAEAIIALKVFPPDHFPGPYKDITWNYNYYGGAIADWTSGTIDDKRAHGGDVNRNDGDMPLFWDKAKERYKFFLFNGNEIGDDPGNWGAYYYVALMTHLTEDMGVPAHAYNIPHGAFLIYDNMEQNVHYNHDDIMPPFNLYDANRNVFNSYNSAKANILSLTASRSPVDWRIFYNLNDINCGFFPLGSTTKKGHYAKTCSGDDSFPTTWFGASASERAAIKTILGYSGSYASGTLLAISRSLPPLVKDFEIPPADTSPANIDMVNGTDITFTILENRTNAVKISITAIDKDNPLNSYYIMANGKTWRNAYTTLASNDTALPNSKLPYEISKTLLNWKGKIEGGTTLPNGTYTMRIEVIDLDGNEVNAVFPDINTDSIPANNTQHDFHIFTPPPAKPTVLRTQTDNASVHLTWARTTTNEDGSPLTDLKGYEVYLSSLMPGDPDALDSGLIVPSGGSLESYDLAPLVNGTTYFIAVRTMDTAGNLSDYSDWISAKPLDAIWVHYPEKISDALQTAGSGDTVMVGPGTYLETQLTLGDHSFSFSPANVMLISERGPAETTILGLGSGDYTFAIEASDRCQIIGFTIRAVSAENSSGIECLFDDDVLISNNVFISNFVSLKVCGTGIASSDPIRIYNNVFACSVTGIQAFSDKGLVEVRNNIFATNDFALEFIDTTSSFFIDYNDFSNNGINVKKKGNNTMQSNKYCAPGFVSFYPSLPASSDFHLSAGTTCARNAGRDFSYWDNIRQQTITWKDCDGTRTDMGAYGGPFAVVDNNGNGLSDCDEPPGSSPSMVVAMNSVDQRVSLQTHDPSGGGLTYTIVTPPEHGSLAGTTPDLTYTVTPDYVGADGFVLAATDSHGVRRAITVAVTVTDPDSPPPDEE